MLDENRILLLLEDAHKRHKVLNSSHKLTPEQNVQKVRLEERIDVLKAVSGEESKSELRDALKEMKTTEWELLRASILVIEQVLVARGFTNQEEIYSNLINVIKHMRERKA